MAEQLSFDLSARPALGREAFFVSEANAVAVAMMDSWRDWPNGKLLLTGDHGAGKTHLAHVWAEDSGAAILPAVDLVQMPVEELARAAICVEDVDQIAGDDPAETQLFHLHNLALAEARPLLMTATGAPESWGIALPDLKSRLQGTSLVRIETPDEALLGALYMKLFSDRQLSPLPDVVPFLARNAPRRFELAGQIVEDMDKAALQDRKRLTRDLARRILAQHTNGAP
ncbi:chromosomal replication initiator DnaA [Roseobacteraceae bacterium S113]